MFPVRAAALLGLIFSVSSSSIGGGGNFNYDLSGQALTDLYNSPVYKAEWMVRPLGSAPVVIGALSHTGVRVTLRDGAQWLIHKGNNFGINSQTVVTSARYMANNWKTLWTRDFRGTKRVADFVKTGGEKYNLLFNCHLASLQMILM